MYTQNPAKRKAAVSSEKPVIKRSKESKESKANQPSNTGI